MLMLNIGCEGATIALEKITALAFIPQSKVTNTASATWLRLPISETHAHGCHKPLVLSTDMMCEADNALTIQLGATMR
jgi:hypothetical protein